MVKRELKMKVVKLVALVAMAVLSLILIISCAEPAETPSVPAPVPAPTPTPATMPIPKEILASHFGFLGAGFDASELSKLGVKWDRPHPGPFIWGRIEQEKGKYDWREVDRYVQEAQRYGFATGPG